MKDDKRKQGEPAQTTPTLQVIEGGRAALEDQAVTAVALGKPDADALSRRLASPANAALSIVRPSDR